MSAFVPVLAGLLSGHLLAQPSPPYPGVGVPSADTINRARSTLGAAALASPRPAECKPTLGRSGATQTIWQRARRPAEGAFCDALAEGYSTLERAPALSLASADRADKALPGRAATELLRARALTAMGRHAEAWKIFESVAARARRSLDEPAALLDYARAALETGHRAEAGAAYRALVPRAALLPDARRRQRVLLEAALTVMAEGPEHLNEATGYLTEARRQRGVPGLSDVVLGALALALDRRGQREEAHGVAAEAGGPAGVMRLGETGGAAGVPSGELHAITAILAERQHPEIAQAEWRAFLASDDEKTSPYRAHAEKKLAPSAPVRHSKPPRVR